MNKDTLNGLITFGLTLMAETKANQEEHKKRIIAEWHNSRNYPRKKKKLVRKRLNVEYAIASYDPFGGMF